MRKDRHLGKISIYTDGACSGNPGPGGWGAIICDEEELITLRGNAIDATNNKMELTAVVAAAQWVVENGKPEYVYNIFIDSAYVINAIKQDWLRKWQSRNWETAKGDRVKNKPLWQKLIKARDTAEMKGFDLNFVKVAGHAGIAFNEHADTVAKHECKKAMHKLGL